MTSPLRSDEARPCGVFAREEILDRMALPVSDVRSWSSRRCSIKTKPWTQIPWTCGLVPTSFFQGRSPRRISVPNRKTATSLHVKVHVPLGQYLVVRAHQTVLGSTLEFIKLPYDAA